MYGDEITSGLSAEARAAQQPRNYVRRIADLWLCGRTAGAIGSEIARLQESGATEAEVRAGYDLAMREIDARDAARRDRGL